MRDTPHHTYQILTKRADVMEHRVNWLVGHYGVLPNVWLGVSVENQEYADKRIPYLLKTPAAVRFLSCEPLLGPVALWPWLPINCGYPPMENPPPPKWTREYCTPYLEGLINWVIIGGESGPGARGLNLKWVRDIISQCQAAGVATFVKQLGADPQDLQLKNSKGGDPAEWPLDLQIREMPTRVTA